MIKYIRHIIIKYIRHILYLLYSFLRKNIQKRYIRINLSNKGKIYFYDNVKKYFFSVFVRERIDSITADQVFTSNDYDLTFLKRYDELLEKYNSILSQNKTPLIIDCGANIGLSAFHFATAFPNSTVVAIEPERNNFLMMEKNCKGFQNVEFLNKAVGSEEGFVSIDNDQVDNNAYRVSRNENEIGDIEIVSINSILSSRNELVPFLIKIDIEGFEDDLFSNNTEWVEKFPLLIIETHDWMLPKQANSHNFLKVISEQQRDFIHKGENIFSISNV